MKLKEAFEIANACGLTDVGEAILNIEFHACNIFNYDEIPKELKELYEDLRNFGLNEDDKIKNALNIINNL